MVTCTPPFHSSLDCGHLDRLAVMAHVQCHHPNSPVLILPVLFSTYSPFHHPSCPLPSCFSTPAFPTRIPCLGVTWLPQLLRKGRHPEMLLLCCLQLAAEVPSMLEGEQEGWEGDGSGAAYPTGGGGAAGSRYASMQQLMQTAKRSSRSMSTHGIQRPPHPLLQ